MHSVSLAFWNFVAELEFDGPVKKNSPILRNFLCRETYLQRRFSYEEPAIPNLEWKRLNFFILFLEFKKLNVFLLFGGVFFYFRGWIDLNIGRVFEPGKFCETSLIQCLIWKNLNFLIWNFSFSLSVKVHFFGHK